MTVVSVGHRAELEAFHTRKIVLERRAGGAKLVSDVNLIPRKGKRRLLGRFLRHRKPAQKGGVSRTRRKKLAVVPAFESRHGDVVGAARKTGYAFAASAKFPRGFLTLTPPHGIAAANDPAAPPRSAPSRRRARKTRSFRSRNAPG